MKIRLWLIRETELARLYSKFDPSGRGGTEPDKGDFVWVPRSVAEHASKRGAEHTVELPEWFVVKNGL